MAITYPITLPSGGRLSLAFKPYAVVAMSMSPFTLAQQAQAHQGQLWVVQVQLMPLIRAEAEEWIAALLSLNGRYGTFYLGDDSAPSPRGTALTLYAQGTVAAGVAKLSVIASAAFADLGAPANLAGMVTSPARRLLVITDSAGKRLTGYLNAAGTTETYGSELLTNGGFTTDTNGWTPLDCTLASVAGGESGNCLEITRVSYLQQYARQDIAAQQAGMLYKMSSYVKSGTSGNEAAIILLYDGNNPTASKSIVTSGSWQLLEMFGGLSGSRIVTRALLGKYTATAGTMLHDTATLKQVLTPSATGATIVTAAGGSTPGWTSEDNGFNRYDVSGYTWQVFDDTGGSSVPLVKGAGQTGQALVTDGWTPNGLGVLLPGDWIQLGSGTAQRIYRVLTSVNPNSSGEATLDIWPRLRESPADNAPITLTNTKGVFRLTHNDMPWDIDSSLIYGIEFSAAEAL